MTKPPLILAITGPTGAGKSTVAHKLAHEIEKCANIDADHVKHFLVSGFIYGESPEGIRQWELLGENIGLLAKNFHRDGYNLIINGYINEPAWRELDKHIELTCKVVLLPTVEELIKRDSGRDNVGKQGEESVRRHHDYFSTHDRFSDFVTIDSSEQSIDETVVLIRSQISNQSG